MRHTPDNIETLEPHEIFVFGSNLLGIHGSGAAKTARLKFGAELGVGEGFTGQCYAFPTLDADSRGGLNLRKRSHYDLQRSVDNFIATALRNPNLTFYLTKVGCGLAGYDEEYMKAFFVATPTNVIKPEGW